MCLLLLSVHPAAARPPVSADRSEAIRVFFDCQVCDEQYIRTEVTFVDYVRDRTAADVHVLVTSQGTGGGGTEYTLRFIGLGRFRDVDNTLTFTAPQTATQDEQGKDISGNFEAQVRTIFSLLDKTLQSCGGSLANMVTMTVFINDPRLGDKFVEMRAGFFPSGNFPASALIT